MKKNKKCALGLVALFAAVAGLSACNAATASDNGAIFTYTDAQGNRVSYSAEDLLNDYQKTGSSLSTEFDKIYEVLVRHYYDTIGGTTMTNLKAKATADVLADKQTAQKNASSNSTTYEVEWEKILTNNSCKNIDDLYQYHLYVEEKTQFQNDIYLTFGTGDSNINGLEAMRDGEYTKNGATTKAFPSSTDWGSENKGWLLDQMPYHTRHILLKFASGKANEFTQDKIGESTTAGEGGETTKLADVVLQLAGAKIGDSGTLTSVDSSNRWTFGTLAKQYSDDSGSAAQYGDNGIMTKVMDSSKDLIHEYKLGIYAFDSLYNQREATSAYGSANAYLLQPGLKEEATKASDVDETQALTDSGTPVNKFFKDKGVGEIPFGAALALLDNADVIKDVNGNVVNEGNDAFYPRNIIYNKYFNQHNVCVITPNAIQMNATSAEADASTQAAANAAINAITPASTDLISENYKGVYSTQFGNLPGFKINTTNVLPSFSNNVLTDSDGQVVLAVRGGSGTSYQGIFFITIQRSALSQYGIVPNTNGSEYKEAAETDVKSNGVYTVDSPSINDYYTVFTPGSTSGKYPTYTTSGTATAMTTFVNFNKQQSSDWVSRSGTITAAIKAFNTSLSTYQFQMLYNSGAITFNDASLKSELENYSTTKRQSDKDDAFTTWAKGWKEYAELIESQDQARSQGAATMTGSLLSEVCAVGYGVSDKTLLTHPELWEKGGACYYATK
jgi:hypothetical protein